MDETTGVITWDEVLYQQIVDARNLYKGLVVVYALVALAAIVMGVICLFALAFFAVGLAISRLKVGRMGVWKGSSTKPSLQPAA